MKINYAAAAAAAEAGIGTAGACLIVSSHTHVIPLIGVRKEYQSVFKNLHMKIL